MTPPKTSHVFSGIEGCQGWYRSDVNITLNASDNFSDILSTQYRIGNDGFQNYSGPFILTREGINNLTYFSIDTLGNTETMNTLTIKIDKTPPETMCYLNPATPNGENGWYTTAIRITLSTGDGNSGINGTWYRLDGGDWQRYMGVLNLQDDGEYTIEYYTTDIACNSEDIKMLDLKIDKENPSINLKKPKEDILYIFDRELVHIPFRTLIIGKVTLEAQATDTTSGIERVLFYVDDEVRYIDTIEPPKWIYDERSILFHRHRLKVKAIDMAGNTKETSELDIWYFNI